MSRPLTQGALPAVCLMLVACALPFGPTPARGQAPGKPPQAPPVAVVAAVQRSVRARQSFVGTVVPLRESTVGSAVDGRVLEFLVDEGDFVRKDQPLARLRTRTIEIELAAARAELEFRRQELAELEQSRPRQIDQARAKSDGAKALMEYTEEKLKRAQSLFERNITSVDELQDARSAAEQARQAFLEAEAALGIVRAMQDVEKARSRVQIQEEEILRLEDRLDKHTVVAPYDGFVVKEHTEVGQWIKQGDAVADVIDVAEVDVEALVLESYLPQLTVGTIAEVEIDALDGQRFTGPVAAIVPLADLRSRSFPVKVRLKNPLADGSPLLKPGMFARIRLDVGRAERAVLLPKDAVNLGGPTPVVFVVDPDPATGQFATDPQSADRRVGKARPVSVTLGVAVDGLVQVKGDVRPGRLIVVEGNERLRPGLDVSFIPPPPAKRSESAEPEQAARRGPPE